MIAAGIVGAVVTGVLADKTKKFEEITKTFFAFAIVSFAGFMVVSTHVVLLFPWLHLSLMSFSEYRFLVRILMGC